MDWTNILNLQAWTPLSEIGTEVKCVMGGVYRIGQYAYLRTQTYNRDLVVGDPRAPFVTTAYWSPSIEGLKRFVNGDPGFHIEGPLPAPPPELVQGGTGLYSEQAKQLVAAGVIGAERAVYSNKGVFLYKKIKIGRLNYCFLSPDNKDEQAFLIEISL
jgi:hypothetical protein